MLARWQAHATGSGSVSLAQWHAGIGMPVAVCRVSPGGGTILETLLSVMPHYWHTVVGYVSAQGIQKDLPMYVYNSPRVSTSSAHARRGGAPVPGMVTAHHLSLCSRTLLLERASQ